MEAINKRAIIIGGSLAGLFAGTLLRTIGWQVDIYERSTHKLDSRGGGIVLQPDVIRAFELAGIATDSLGVDVVERYYLDRDGSIDKMAMRQTLTSWNILYRAMRRQFPDVHYHQGKVLEQVESQSEKVTAIFEDGSCTTADLLIGADGPNSTVRQQLLPEYIPKYAGYVAYRGVIDESVVGKENGLDLDTAAIFTERFVFYDFPNSQILAYLIPGGNESLTAGKRRFNWVWYVNYDEHTELPAILTDVNSRSRTHSIPPGMIAPAVEQAMQDYANVVLADPFKKLVAATKEPFVQSIVDLTVPQMAFNNIALIGDAAFIPRPHTAASTAKAAANAIALVEALIRHNHNVQSALTDWEPDQLQYGKRLCQHGRQLGDRSQFAYGTARLLV